MLIMSEIPGRVGKVSLRHPRHHIRYMDILRRVIAESSSKFAPWFVREPKIKDKNLIKHKDKHKTIRRMALYFCSHYAGGNLKKLRKYFKASKKEINQSLDLPHKASDLLMYEKVERSLCEEDKMIIPLNLTNDSILSSSEWSEIEKEYGTDVNKKPIPKSELWFSPTFCRADE
jgi:hypothetical protein